MTKKLSKSIAVLVLSMVMVFAAVVPTFAATYVENHNYVDCANYYIDGSKYMFLIKIPIGTPLSAITVKDAYTDTTKKLSEITNTGAERLEYQYSDSISDCYMYSYNLSAFGTPKYSWYYYGIKLYYDYNGCYYMATNTSNNSTTEGPGYKLIR